MFKKVNVQTCDICGHYECPVGRHEFFDGWGYKPSFYDPFAQKHSKLTINFDLCRKCLDGVQEKACSYSKNERSDLVAVAVVKEYIAKNS